MKKWICSVCGYISQGEEPPEICPMCGAPKEKFILLIETAPAKTETEAGGLTSAAGYALEADVLIVGSGAAAFSAAITARKQGASVIMLEKAAKVGGTTLRSGGGFWTPNNRFQHDLGIEDKKEDAIRYMARYSFPHLYNPNDAKYGVPKNEFELLSAMAEHASEMVEFLEDCGALHSIAEINWTGKPQVDYMDHLPENKGIRGRVLYTQNPEGKLSYGFELIRQLETWARSHDILILTDHRVMKIMQNEQKEVIGLEVVKENKRDFEKDNSEIIVVEIGGTVGDIESLPFLEAASELKNEERMFTFSCDICSIS